MPEHHAGLPAEGEIVTWLNKTYVATKPSCNRTPHTYSAGFRQCWSEIEPVVVDALFAPPLAIEEGPDEDDAAARRHVNDWAMQELADQDIVEAEIVDEQ
jgi:hypothetical protein